MANGLSYKRVTATPEATKQLAFSLASFLRAGDVIVLRGDLGAGKTQFVQGVAQALGIRQQVTSPTFNIQITYEAPLPLNHFDLYRLETAEELDDIGYWDTLDGPGVSFIEWGDKFPDDMPTDYIDIEIVVDEEGQRTVKAHSVGERARRRLFLWASDTRSRLKKA